MSPLVAHGQDLLHIVGVIFDAPPQVCVFSEFEVEAVVCPALSEKPDVEAAALQCVLAACLLPEVQQVAFNRHRQKSVGGYAAESGHIFLALGGAFRFDDPFYLRPYPGLVGYLPCAR